MEATKPRVPIG